MRPKVDSVRDQAVDLMTNRGDHCRKVIEPKLTELNQRFATISQRIKSEKVGRIALAWSYVFVLNRKLTKRVQFFKDTFLQNKACSGICVHVCVFVYMHHV